MELQEAKKRFIQLWGEVGTNWGIPKSMAMVHAYLLINDKEVDQDMIKDDLELSKGIVHLNLKTLIKMGLVERIDITGNRRDYYRAEYDVYKIAKIVAIERKQTELEPLIEEIKDLLDIEGGMEKIHFEKTIRDIAAFAEQANKILELFIVSRSLKGLSLFMKTLQKV